MRAATAYLAVFALALALFLLLPQIDLMTSALFYTSDRGFLLKNWRLAAWLYNTVPWLAWGIAVLIAFGTCWLLLVERPLWRLDRKALCFIALSMVLAPGLIVNTLLKDHWGRAQPNQIAEFGGTRQYSPAPLPVVQCRRNCSFPSGHAALGFSLVALAFLLPQGAALAWHRWHTPKGVPRDRFRQSRTAALAFAELHRRANVRFLIWINEGFAESLRQSHIINLNPRPFGSGQKKRRISQ
jgi:lipid A 4'-phosphatase